MPVSISVLLSQPTCCFFQGTHISTAKSKGQLSHLDGLSFSLQLYHDGTMEESETGRPSLFTNCVQ